ncbi:hypothetical protein CL1_1494 [Thermococcus cleftensis]|uniref:HhH-GPD domain-containing protein n=1 Tax=Thermococcus cleftensis (strain DSM 27260 / KACC 17922 / CL1) TaxID=163003 RepID=I3ZVF9_THECF|nr:hypothetical protein [Thermococcus cleftensis]AFL95693.1 hypothetical protein CL1_1494 [Thermococcus cleftensis]
MDLDLSTLGVTCENYYKKYGRRFFWRVMDLTPFQVLTTEFLLWKTRAENVDKYGRDLILKASTPEVLLEIPVEKIQESIRPLGLYRRRTRLLVRIAETLVSEYDGIVPKDAHELLSIPGVGSYVTAATLLFAHDLPYIPLDSNVETYLSSVAENLGFSVEDRRYPLRDEYIEFSRKFFNKVRSRKYAGWGLLDLASLHRRENKK